MKRYLTEFLGTLILALAVSFSLAGGFPVAAPVIAGLALGLGFYTMGSISGAHLNPAVTFGLLLVKKIEMKEAALYWVAQVLGAAAAMHLANYLMDPVTLTAGPDNIGIILSEMLGAIVFGLGVAAVANGRVSAGATGLVIGSSLLLGMSLATGSHGVLNPAVALAIGSFSLSYLIGPLAGVAIAMLLYKHLTE